MYELMSKEDLLECVPKGLKRTITEDTLDKLNRVFSQDPDMVETFREKIIGYSYILQQGKFRMEQYFDAIRYVSYKMAGLTNKDAYARTFPERMEDHRRKGLPPKHIATLYTSFHKSKLVTMLLEQAMVPVSILNADVFQDAVNKQRQIMMDPTASHKVQSDAADSLMRNLKPAEASKLEIDVTHKQSSVLDELRKATQELALGQQNSIKLGVDTAQTIADAKIIAGVVIDG